MYIVLHTVLQAFQLIPELTTTHIEVLFKKSYLLYGFFVLLAAWVVGKEIRESYVFKLTGCYFLYLLLSYSLTITRNLNNGGFEPLDFTGNGFFQFSFLTPLALILCLAGIFRLCRGWFEKKLKRTKVGKLLTISSESSVTLHALMAGVVLSDTLSMQVITRLYAPLATGSLFELYSKLIIYILMLFVAYSLLSFFLLGGYEALRSNKPNLSIIVSSSFLFALLFNYTLQYGLKRDAALMKMYIFPAATIYQVLLIFILCLVVYLIFNRYILSTLLILAFWSTVSVINIIKMDMRNEPLLATDFSWIKQINSVVEFVDDTIVLAIITGLATILIVYLVLRKRILPGKILSSIGVRIVLLLAIFGILASGFTIFRNEKKRLIQDGVPILSQLNNNYNAFWLDLSYHARYRSLLFVWTKQLTAKVVETPPDYSKERMEELAEKYEKIAEEINKERSGYLNDQTVIFVLSESYANPNRLADIKISKDIMPNIRKIMSNNTSGTMRSDAYGGGTANMEWQSLVGLPMYNMSESISTINTEVVPKMSVIPSISDLFLPEDRLAIHLGDADLYSRNDLYMDKLHFADFVAGKNGTRKPDDFNRLGLFPSDNSTYKSVLKEINTEKNQFLSVITYQNHIPYSYDKPTDLVASGKNFTDEQNNSLTSYSRLMYYTDLETKAFLDELSKLKKKVTVVFYGDHLPGFYPQSQFEALPDTQYETDYFIWSNYQQVAHDFPYVGSSDFPAAVLAHTDSKVSPYYALLTRVLEKETLIKDSIDYDKREVEKDLLLVEYDLTSGNGYLQDTKNFFEVTDPQLSN